MTRIASQWGEALDQRLLAQRPDLDLLSLDAGIPELPLPADVSVLLARPFPPAQRSAPPPAGWPWGLRWVQLLSVGLDAYPSWLLRTPGLQVSTAHGSSSETIADFVLASVLRVQLRLQERRAQGPADWRLSEAPALAGSMLGIVGFGGIGQALARRALALGLQVQVLRRGDAPPELAGVVSTVNRAADLASLLQSSDHVVLAAPATPQTRHLINAASLAHARPGLHLVNVARGSLVDQDALRQALDSGRIGWASLDVTEPEPLPEGHWLYQHPRVWLTPHTCAISPQVQQTLVAKLLRSLDRRAQGLQPEDLVQLERGY